jgi:hypothetical protein
MLKYLQVIWNYLLLEAKQPLQKCPIQTIFNKVIDAGHYIEVGPSRFMCLSLAAAALRGVITDAEYKRAKAAIADYLAPTGQCTLADALRSTRIYSPIFSARLKLYQNWAKRPNLEAQNG